MPISSFLYFLTTQVLKPILLIIGVGLIVFLIIKKLYTRRAAVLAIVIYLLVSMPLFTRLMVGKKLHTFGPAAGPSMSLKNAFDFFAKVGEMEKVADISHNPNDVPAAITRTVSTNIKIELEAKEVIGQMADGVTFNYWTYNGTVPGPILRVREGDTVELTLKNHPSSIHNHNIDLHAATGPGGGATVSNVAPGESKTFTFKALNPGLYVYHCAYPNVATHSAHGMYGMILVEPKEGLAKVDQEFYIMQGEFYITGRLGKRGLQIFDAKKMLDGRPQYIVWNGRTGGAVDVMKAKVGERIRLYVGNGGVNLVSSFHVIGEIFDVVYPEAAMGIGSSVFRNVQTTVIPAGGSTIVEFTVDVPGKYILVDHALSRLDRGAWGTIEVTGEARPEIFNGIFGQNASGH